MYIYNINIDICIYREHDDKPAIDGYPSVKANKANSWPWRVCTLLDIMLGLGLKHGLSIQ